MASNSLRRCTLQRGSQTQLPLVGRVPSPHMPVTAYCFLLVTPDRAWWHKGMGLQSHLPTDASDSRLLASYETPVWVRDSVFYEIFPDRFADSEAGNNVKDGKFEYGGVQSRARRRDEPQVRWPQAMEEFYGGDLPGVQQHVDYLQGLGVNAIYFSSVSTAYSNHRRPVVDMERHFANSSADGPELFRVDVYPCLPSQPAFKSGNRSDPRRNSRRIASEELREQQIAFRSV